MILYLNRLNKPQLHCFRHKREVYLFSNSTRVSNATRRSLRAVGSWGSWGASRTRGTRWTLGYKRISNDTSRGKVLVILLIQQSLTIWPTSPVSPFSPGGPGRPWGVCRGFNHNVSVFLNDCILLQFILFHRSPHLQPNWTWRSGESSRSFVSLLSKQTLLTSGTGLTICTLYNATDERSHNQEIQRLGVLLAQSWNPLAIGPTLI